LTIKNDEWFILIWYFYEKTPKKILIISSIYVYTNNGLLTDFDLNKNLATLWKSHKKETKYNGKRLTDFLF